MLGDEHNLIVFRATIEKEADAFCGMEAVFGLIARADIRQCELRARARRLGAELYADTPEAFAARCRAAWERGIAEAGNETRAEKEMPPPRLVAG